MEGRNIESNREKVNGKNTIPEIAVQMSEGNPGAITVLGMLLRIGEPDPGWALMLTLDDMNMRGSQIWVAFKDHCGENIEKLAGLIKNRDQDMVNTVNEQCFNPSLGEGYSELAVTSGASWAHK